MMGDPTGWIYKANQYFKIYQIPSSQKVLNIFFYMKGDALVWFQDAEEGGVFTSWEAFVKALL